MKSSALLRTNTGLTTNVKIMINSNYKLSLSSIESDIELSNSKYRKVSFNKKSYYDDLLTHFYDGLPSDIAFSIAYDNDVDSMSTNYSEQYDDLYQYGAKNISNNKEYDEDYEYFAPLYIGNTLPSNFIIFRIDGSGIEEINKDNFRTNILRKLKTIKLFDLSKNTYLGEWLDMNYINNSFFPLSPFEMNYSNLEFSKWNGIDYENGGYISKSIFLESVINHEKEIYEFEKYIFNGYKNNKIVFPNILNMSFLFSDSPLPWTINRYYGFYLDSMDIVTKVSIFKTPELKSVTVVDNYLISNGDPFVDGYKETNKIEYLGEYYNVTKIIEYGDDILQPTIVGDVIIEQYRPEEIIKYKIISDTPLDGKENLFNKNTISIIDNKIIGLDIDMSVADVWLIEIDGLYYNLINNNDEVFINSDYIFNSDDNSYTYNNIIKNIDITKPNSFNIFKLKFTDIKDFDTRIIDTEYSKYEYEKKDTLTLTDESKMYLVNLDSKSNPKNYDDFYFNEDVVNIPVSSEYTANYETFKITNNELSDIWRKNPVYCRWCFQNSLSANDMPYLLNNSLLFEDFNRTTNPYNVIPNRIDRNLDYFYTINSSTASYTHHTLHIEKIKDGEIDTNFNFELNKYISNENDYFSEIFDANVVFGDYNKNVKKYSVFNHGNLHLPNITLFRGMKYLIYDVSSTNKSKNNINLQASNLYADYKFSILLSKNNYDIDLTGKLIEIDNQMDWTIIDEWEMDKQYKTNDIVIKDNILYTAIQDNIITSPISANLIPSAPYNTPEYWSLYENNNSIFWYPDRFYNIDDYVYNDNYYVCIDNLSVEDFWNPKNIYASGSVVLFNDKYYTSTIDNNKHRPDYKIPYDVNITKNEDRSISLGYDVYDVLGDYFWVATQSSAPKWKTIEIWNPGLSYNSGSYIIHNDILYKSTVLTSEEPGISSNWIKIYSLVPDTNMKYKPNNNPIIRMNNAYYLINSNSTNSTIQNGINIYINKKWKNILININISDNTIPNISNSDRDDLYTSLSEKLTLHNFNKCLSDISNKYDFADTLKYVILDDDIKVYDYNNMNNIPCFIVTELPDKVTMEHDSLSYIPIKLPIVLKPKKILDNIKNDLSNLNYYNNIPISANITNNLEMSLDIPNYNSMNNITKDIIYRYSGFYMPLLYDIQLFDNNYLFNVSLSDFGIIKERKIRKINHKGSILRLANSTEYKSIYPMVQEFGYDVVDDFIFKSPWDLRYHYITNNIITKPSNNYMDVKIGKINIL
ncbi:MAG: hypothetical protein M0R46_10585 [Candidatus Muirbacterium halophilum]|nr:hypothetical protein [Candidatus Muirbacterium halophilum]